MVVFVGDMLEKLCIRQPGQVYGHRRKSLEKYQLLARNANVKHCQPVHYLTAHEI